MTEREAWIEQQIRAMRHDGIMVDAAILRTYLSDAMAFADAHRETVSRAERLVSNAEPKEK